MQQRVEQGMICADTTLFVGRVGSSSTDVCFDSAEKQAMNLNVLDKFGCLAARFGIWQRG
jgi:hypothetical protein